jgi:heat induced stress protein YflT
MANPRDPTGSAVAGQARRTIASYPSYEEAERAVDHLADSGFPVERVSIVGRGLHYVEQITGRMGYPQAALRGALTGAIIGALIGWLFGLFDWFEPLVAAAWLAFDGFWFGGVVGALIGLLMHALLRGRRDFSSVAGMRADTYEVLADADVAEEAARLLAGFSGATPVAPVSTPQGQGGQPPGGQGGPAKAA